MRAIAAAVTLLASIPNCTDLYSIATHGLSTPVVTTQQTADVATDSGGLRLTVPITVQNPNDVPIAIDSVDYTVRVNPSPNATIADGGTDASGFRGTHDSVTVDEHTTDTISLSIVIPPAAFLALRPGTNTFNISGTVHADSPAGIGIDVTFTGSGSFTTP